MRGIAALAAAGITGLAHAGFAGTKGDPLGSSTAGASGIGFMSMVQMAIALGIVMLLLKVLLPKVAGKLNKRLVAPVGSAIRIEESAAFAGGSLYIVTAKKRTLLLSVATTGVSCLADLTETAAQPEPLTFQEMVEAEEAAPLQPFAIVTESQPTPDVERVDAAAALERLKRLSV